MDSYHLVRLIHIVSASVLFGTGIGIAFFMFRAYLSGNREAMAVTTANVVLADWVFTTPAVIVQAATGLWLTARLSIPLNSLWFVLVVALFILVGACWIPVVLIQIRIRNIISSGGDTHRYRSLMRAWAGLGIPAFLGVLVLYFLMITKHGMSVMVFN